MPNLIIPLWEVTIAPHLDHHKCSLLQSVARLVFLKFSQVSAPLLLRHQQWLLIDSKMKVVFWLPSQSTKVFHS